MNASHAPRPAAIVVIAAVAGSIAAIVLGLLTFGAQATVRPDGVPVAVAADGPLRQGAEQLAGRAGDELSVRVVSSEEGRRLLDDKAVYGVLELSPGGQGLRAAGMENPGRGMS